MAQRKDNEPDRWLEEWSDGWALHAVRHPRLGHWCGYVGVPEGDPLFGHDELDPRFEEIQVHGGLTFAGRDGPDWKGRQRWWYGFDCAHAGDLVPTELPPHEKRVLDLLGNDHPGRSMVETYRDLAFVKQETRNLYRQLRQASQKDPAVDKERGA